MCRASCSRSCRSVPTSARPRRRARRCGPSRAGPTSRPQHPDRHLLDSAAVSKAEKRERQKENRERAREERERLQKRARQMKTFRSLLIVLIPIMVILVIVSLTSNGDDSASASFDAKKFYTATIETTEGNIVLALDQSTPKATGAFVKFAEAGKYNGTCIDRIARDFVIQG